MNISVEDALKLSNLESGMVIHRGSTEPDEENATLPSLLDQRATASKTIAYLDGLRGLAALMVYWFHHVSWFYGPQDEIQYGFGYKDASRYFVTLPFVRVFWTGGSAAVSIFFVLSGYVLSRSPLRMLRDGENPQRYVVSAAIRRPFRLFIPTIGVSLAMVFALQLPIRPLLSWPPAQSNIFGELWNFVFELPQALNPFVEHGPESKWFPYNPPIWTMSYEFKGSLLVFGVIAVGVTLPRKTRLLTYAILSLLLFFIGSWAMACFLFGVLLAVNDLNGLDQPYLRGFPSCTCTTIFHVVFFSGWYLLSQVNGDRDPERSSKVFGWYFLTMLIPANYKAKEYWRFWNSIGAAMVIYGVLRIRWLQKRLNSLNYLGKISFSLYLTHLPFLWVVGDRVYRFFGYKRPEFEYNSIFDDILVVPDLGPRGLTTKFLIAQMVILSSNMVLAHYSTKWLDEPSITAGKWVSVKVLGG
ncbi:Fc.00g116010.m01.CDS01 [Cosmosporella sp. VM-42]